MKSAAIRSLPQWRLLHLPTNAALRFGTLAFRSIPKMRRSDGPESTVLFFLRSFLSFEESTLLALLVEASISVQRTMKPTLAMPQS